MRTDRHRFTVWTDPKAPAQPLAVELYDARPGAIETASIAGRPERAALVRELSAQLAAGWRAAGPPKQ